MAVKCRGARPTTALNFLHTAYTEVETVGAALSRVGGWD